jgi:hypothetical protein
MNKQEQWTSSKMRGTEGNCIMAQVFDGNGLSLAVIDSRYGETESTSNAKLISAAPDLLEALEGMIDIFGSEIDGDSIMAIRTARKAIKKATS